MLRIPQTFFVVASLLALAHGAAVTSTIPATVQVAPTTTSKVPEPHFTISATTVTSVLGPTTWICTTTQTNWFDWKSAPTPTPYYTACDTPQQRGPPFSGISRGPGSGDTQSFFVDINEGFEIVDCCVLCQEIPNCAMYEVKSGSSSSDPSVCLLYIVSKGLGTKTDMCSNGIYEMEEAVPIEGIPTDEVKYVGGRLLGPCGAAGKLWSSKCNRKK